MGKKYDNKNRLLLPGESQRRDGRYMFRYTDYLGKRRTEYSWKLVERDKTPYGKRDDISLREKEVMIERDKSDFLVYNAGKKTLNELFDDYVSFRKRTGKLKERSLINYVHVWNKNIRNRSCSNMPINTIRRKHIISLYQELLDDNVGNGSITLIHKNISAALNFAVKEDYIRRNFSTGALQEMNIYNNKRNALTIDEQYRFLKYVAEKKCYYKYYWMFVFMFETACRGSETFGLTWNDIDLDNKLVSINHQLLYKERDGNDKEYIIEPPKTKSSIRYIPLSDKAVQALIQQKDMLIRYNRINNYNIDDYKDFVFLTVNYKLWKISYLDQVLRDIVASYNDKEHRDAVIENRKPTLLPKITAHILRHTACTRLAECGVDARTLQEIMGHNCLNITMSVYNHVDTNRMKREIEKLNVSSSMNEPA